MTRIFRAAAVGMTVAFATALGGVHTAQAVERLAPGDPFDPGATPVAVQMSDCDSKGSTFEGKRPIGVSFVEKAGSSRCANVKLG